MSDATPGIDQLNTSRWSEAQRPPPPHNWDGWPQEIVCTCMESNLGPRGVIFPRSHKLNYQANPLGLTIIVIHNIENQVHALQCYPN